MVEFLFFAMLFVAITCVLISQLREDSEEEIDWGRPEKDEDDGHP